MPIKKGRKGPKGARSTTQRNETSQGTNNHQVNEFAGVQPNPDRGSSGTPFPEEQYLFPNQLQFKRQLEKALGHDPKGINSTGNKEKGGK